MLAFNGQACPAGYAEKIAKWRRAMNGFRQFLPNA